MPYATVDLIPYEVCADVKATVRTCQKCVSAWRCASAGLLQAGSICADENGPQEHSIALDEDAVRLVSPVSQVALP